MQQNCALQSVTLKGWITFTFHESDSDFWISPTKTNLSALIFFDSLIARSALAWHNRNYFALFRILLGSHILGTFIVFLAIFACVSSFDHLCATIQAFTL